MKIAIEMFSTVVVITLACILFSSIISSNNQNMEARDFYNVVVNRIEDSNCNVSVVSMCMQEAKEKGYDLSIKNVTVYQENPSNLVTMKYQVTLPVFSLFGNDNKKGAMIEGYAR